MLKRIFWNQLVPFLLAIIVTSLFVFSIPESSYSEKIIVEKSQMKTEGRYANLTSGDQAEIDFISSIKNKKQLTIFGSSEFSESPYCSYNFLPDSFGIQTLGIGHAFHQHFSILCELLAADEYVENSKVCIVLSPGWFEKNGTNTSAFIEFVRPNFLNRIVNNEKIKDSYKFHIGKYIDDNYSEFNGSSTSMIDLRDEYLIQNNYSHLRFIAHLRKAIKKKSGKTYPLKRIEYKTDLKYLPVKDKNQNIQYKDLQKDFISKITNNDIYVYDEYYEKYLLDEDGNPKKGKVNKIDFVDNRELEDFNLLVKYLVEKSVDCSFIIQPLNPYYYKNAAINGPLIDTLTAVLDKRNIPYLNMYVSNKEDYDPGTLKDVMHLGDYGWMKINYFLDSLYHE